MSSSAAGPRTLPPNPARQELFNKLKPPCTTLSAAILTATPSPRGLTSALTTLHETLTSLTTEESSTLDPKIGDYIFFPLSHVFRRYATLPDRSLELALLCLHVLINTCWRLHVPEELGRQLGILLTFVIGGAPGAAEKGQGKGEGERSEETRLAGVRCLKALFDAVVRGGTGVGSEGSRGGLVANLPALGHTVSTLLECVGGADGVELQSEAVEALRTLVVEVLDDEKESDVRAGFYPGVVSGLIRAVGLGATTQLPYRVLIGVVGLVAKLVCAVLADAKVAALPETDDDDDEEEEEVVRNSNGKSGVEDELRVHRTKSWVKMTAANTKVALEQLLKLRTHPKLDVRQAVFALCRDVLENCENTLQEAVMPLVESMVVLSGDVDESLARLAENTVRVMASLNEHVKDSVRACLDRWIAVLPRVMTGNDEDAKERVIQRLSLTFGLCAELGMETELLRDMLAASIKDSLIAASAPAKKGNKGVSVQSSSSISAIQPRLAALVLQEEEGQPTGPGEKLQPFPDVLMSQRSQHGTLQSMKQLLGDLGKSSDADALQLAQHHVRSASVRGGPSRERATSLWIAINLLRGSLQESSEMDLFLDLGMVEPNPLQRHVTDELFSLALSYLTNTAEYEDQGTEEGAMLQCLALESLSLIAQTQKRAFRDELVEALYPIVHALGDASPAVQTHAMIALNNVTASTEYADVRELLLENADYMVNAVSLKLNIFDLSPQAPQVLGMMLKLVGPSLVPFLDDLVVDMIAILDGFHEYEKLCQALFEVLGTVVEESAKASPEVLMIGLGGEEAPPRHRVNKPLTDAGLVQLLREDRERKSRSRADDDDDDDEESTPHRPWGKPKDTPGGPNPDDPDDPDNPDNPDDPPPRTPSPEPPALTPTYKIIQKITSLTQHYLPHHSFALRLRVLRLVTTAATALAGNENAFLPLLNEIWSMVVDRLVHDDEAAVQVEACRAVTALSVGAGDFVGTRWSDMWPGIRRVWERTEKKRRPAAGGNWGGQGIYSPHYKLWDAIIRMVAKVVGAVWIPDDTLTDIVVTFGEVLAAEGEGERKDLVQALDEVAADEVWLEVMSRKGPGSWGEEMPSGMEEYQWGAVAF